MSDQHGGRGCGYPWKFVVEWISEGEGALRAVKRIYAYGKTRYQEFMVAELAGVGKSLIIDGKVQSSLHDEHWYHEALVHPVLVAHPKPERVLIIGGGEGATAREVLRHKQIREVTMVELDDSIVNASRNHLPEWHQGAFDDPRLRLMFDDGRAFLERVKGEYDVVILDLVDPLEGGPALRLYTVEFYSLVKRALRPGGIMVTQATSPTLYPRVFATVRNTVAAVFKIARAYATYVRSYNGMWGFVAGSDELDPAALSAEQVDEVLRKRGVKGLRFYDGTTHVWMFSLPKPIRKDLEAVKEYATDENPVHLDV
ncbi:MAG: polyamine aminopropyltransferase [Thermoproteota archaeon]